MLNPLSHLTEHADKAAADKQTKEKTLTQNWLTKECSNLLAFVINFVDIIESFHLI